MDLWAKYLTLYDNTPSVGPGDFHDMRPLGPLPRYEQKNASPPPFLPAPVLLLSGDVLVTVALFALTHSPSVE